MVSRRPPFTEALLDALAVWPLSAGVLTALFAMTAIDGGAARCLGAAFIAVAAVTALSRRWWLALCAVGVGGVCLAAVCWRVSAARLFLGDYLRWLSAGAAYKAGETDDGFLRLSGAMITVLVCAALFAYSRRAMKPRRFVLLACLCAAVVIAAAIRAGGDFTAAVCLIASGLIVTLPRVYAARSGTGDVGRAALQLVAVPAAVLAAALALIVVPKDARAWQSHTLATWADDAATWLGDSDTGRARAAADFDLRRAGYASSMERLGGAVAFSGERFLYVQSERPVLLKGKVLDYYDGHSWHEMGGAGDLRLNSPLWAKARREAFDLDKPIGGAAARALYEALTASVDVSVVWANGGAVNTLFAPENAEAVTMDKPTDKRFRGVDVYFNRRGELYAHARVPFAAYQIRARVWERGAPGFDALFAQLAAQTADPDRYKEIQSRYTQLPINLPDSVREQAIDMTRNADTPYAKARAIQTWLAGNTAYTLTPTAPPADMDFTAHFLQTREGYCVYYATAMAVLARCVGLPARYVQGFALQPSEDGTHYEATDKTAHAWSEVYFEGVGWLAMDPLNGAPNPNAPNSAAAPPSLPPLKTPPPAAPAKQAGANANAKSPANGARAWLWVLSTAAVLAGLYGALLFWIPRYFARRLDAGGQSAAERLNALYADIAALLRMCGVTPRPSETLVTFPIRVDAQIALDGAALASVSEALARLYYKGEAPSEGAVALARRYHRLLSVYTLARIGRNRYVWRRLRTCIHKQNDGFTSEFLPPARNDERRVPVAVRK